MAVQPLLLAAYRQESNYDFHDWDSRIQIIFQYSFFIKPNLGLFCWGIKFHILDQAQQNLEFKDSETQRLSHQTTHQS